ncbi:MAG: N-formylglutamate amidohydrolase [Gemmatimonadota bacterium]
MDDFLPFRIAEPTVAPAAVLVDSPHSGMEWPADFCTVAPRDAISTTWDAFVDELWSGAPAAGATLIVARFPRAYIDANRAVDDIDSELLAEPWPSLLAPTAYSERGMGLIRRSALPGVPMYDRLLRVDEVQRRIATCHAPYRAALDQELSRLHAQFGVVWHINAHSMKSRGNAMNLDAGAARADVVVSDRRGMTADPAHTRWVADWFRARGYRTRVNDPYQGGDIVACAGDPATGRHSVQVEFNRALYMDEATISRGTRFAELQACCTAFLHAIADRAVADRASHGTA